MKLPPYNPPVAFSDIQKCRVETRKRITKIVDDVLKRHCTAREVEAICDALEGVRADLASMALAKKREDQKEKSSHFQNDIEVFKAKGTPKLTAAQFDKGTKGLKANGKRG